MEQEPYAPASAEAVLRFQQKRLIVALFTDYLQLLESVCNDHDIALDKLVRALPTEYGKYVDLADYLTPEKAQELRKRILDRGNDTWRAFDDLAKSYNIQFR